MASKILDTIYTYKFLRLLSMKWEDTDAYKLGIIDEDGNPLKKYKDLDTKEEKDAYSSFVRMVFKFKRILSKVPGGKSAVVRYSAALALIKEYREEVEKMGVDFKKLEEMLTEEVTNTTTGIEGKEQPLGKKGEVEKKRKKKESKDDEIVVKENVVYQVIGESVIRIVEKKYRVKRRIKNGKRIKRREVVGSKRYTRTGNRKLRGGAKTKFKMKHKRAYRKAHTASAEMKRKRSMRKRKSFGAK